MNGFVAGTLVHTKDGLRAIESLQVGDWVLAKDESGQGDTAYKRVLQTHRFEDKEIWYLEFVVFDNASGNYPSPSWGFLTCTRNHPFWVRGSYEYSYELDGDVLVMNEGSCDQWRRADLLYPGMVLELESGELVKVEKSLYVAQTPNQYLGFLQGDGMPESWSLEREGRLIEFTEQGPASDSDASLMLNAAMEDLGEEFYFPTYRTTVYNIEVEDFHTYYVGEMGVWVHE